MSLNLWEHRELISELPYRCVWTKNYWQADIGEIRLGEDFPHCGEDQEAVFALVRFSEFLKLKRIERDLITTDTSTLLGVSRDAYMAWEKGKRLPDKKNLQKIVDKFGHTGIFHKLWRLEQEERK